MVTLRRLRTPPPATSATPATWGPKPAEPLGAPGSRPPATPCYPPALSVPRPFPRDPGSNEVAAPLPPPKPSNDAGFLPEVAEVADTVDLPPDEPCSACRSGRFHRAPGGPWRCTSCYPPALPADLTGWIFCGAPGGRLLELSPLSPPPVDPRLPVHLDERLPDPQTAPLGRCSRCRFIAALTAEGWCGACVTKRAAAGTRGAR